MAIYAILAGRSILLEKINISAQQSKITTFDISVPLLALSKIGDPYLSIVKIFDDGLPIIEGVVRTPVFTPDFQSNISSPATVKLQCDTLLGLLQCEPAAVIHFQDIPLSTAIGTLLSRTIDSSWQINDISTLTDSQITADVRNKKTIWSQLTGLIELAQTPTYLRYGGQQSDGTHLLDIGEFGEQVLGQRAELGFNLTKEPRFKAPTREPIKRLYPVSGKTGDVTVNLLDALNIDETLDDASRDIRLVDSADGPYLLNTLVDKGCNTREVYDAIKTENNEAPTQAELNETALALFYKAERDIRQSLPYYNVSVQAALDKPPLEHSKVFFSGTVFNEDYDLYTERRTLQEAFSLREWMRLIDYKASFEESRVLPDYLTERTATKFIYDLSLSTQDDRDTYEPAEIVSKKTQNNSIYDQTTIDIPPVQFFGTKDVTVTHNNVAPNCVTSTGKYGRQFVFVAPTPPAGATDAIVTVKSVSLTGVIVEALRFGNINTNANYCLSGPNKTNWTRFTNITMVVTWSYTG